MKRKAWLTILLAVVCGCILSGCGYGAYAVAGIAHNLKGNTVNHGFEFDAISDSPGVEIMDYEYSTRKPSKEAYARIGGNGIAQQTGISGGFPRGDFVYMKWRVRSTGEIFEDRVDLRSRIPGNIKEKTIYCVIEGGQLYVLLIDFWKYKDRVTTEELTKARAGATTPLKKVLNSHILYHVEQVYPEPKKQLQ